jgi:hypothetical protein
MALYGLLRVMMLVGGGRGTAAKRGEEVVWNSGDAMMSCSTRRVASAASSPPATAPL